MANVNWGHSFDRNFSGPLDLESYFKTYSEMLSNKFVFDGGIFSVYKDPQPALNGIYLARLNSSTNRYEFIKAGTGGNGGSGDGVLHVFIEEDEIDNYNYGDELVFVYEPKDKIQIPIIEESYEYTGSVITVPLGTSNYTITYSPSEIKNVGSYTATVELKDEDNYMWDGDKLPSYTFNFRITPKPISVPLNQTIVYGDNYEDVMVGNNYYDVNSSSGTISNAGVYNFVYALKDNANTKWSDDTTENKNITLTINKKTITVNPEYSREYTGDVIDLNGLITGFDGYLIDSQGQTLLDKGDYRVILKLNDKNNYYWLVGEDDPTSEDITITIKIASDISWYFGEQFPIKFS